MGQKVVFVDDTGIDNPEIVGNRYRFIFPAKGSVYTIRNITVSDFTGDAVLLLKEIDNRGTADATGWMKEPGIEACRFRPVIERKTDISIFTAMLNKPTVRVTA
jgi:hypothetical protein